MNGYPTSRKYARTLADAFPDVRACAIEHHRAPGANLKEALCAGACLALCVLIGAMIYLGVRA